MVKLALIIASVFLVAAASAYRTTITTTVIEEENPTGRQQQCRERISTERISHCEMYLSQSGPYEAALRSIVNQQQQHLRLCCSQLQNISEECRCEAIRQVVRQQQRQQEEMQEVMRMARELPRRCNMEPRECRIQAVFV